MSLARQQVSYVFVLRIAMDVIVTLIRHRSRNPKWNLFTKKKFQKGLHIIFGVANGKAASENNM
jgi:hypothetical protein